MLAGAGDVGRVQANTPDPQAHPVPTSQAERATHRALTASFTPQPPRRTAAPPDLKLSLPYFSPLRHPLQQQLQNYTETGCTSTPSARSLLSCDSHLGCDNHSTFSCGSRAICWRSLPGLPSSPLLPALPPPRSPARRSAQGSGSRPVLQPRALPDLSLPAFLAFPGAGLGHRGKPSFPVSGEGCGTAWAGRVGTKE